MKKKILFINGHLNAGGVERSLVDILKHIDYQKYDVDLLLLEERGDYVAEIPSNVSVRLLSLKNTYGSVLHSLCQCLRKKDWICFKMRVVFLAMKLLGQNKIAWARKALTNNIRYDCAIGFRPGICTQIAAYAVYAQKRIAWWHHGEVNIDRNEYLAAVNHCDQVAVVSQACCKMLMAEFPSLINKFTVIPNMIDVEAIEKKALEYCPYADGTLLHIVSICRFSAEKCVENVLFVAKKLKERNITFCWHLIGDGELKDKLRKTASDYNILDVLVFEGIQPNPYPYLKAANLFVHPSYVESQGIVVLEAMALGIPCVVTKSIGPCEFIFDEINGLLTEQHRDALAAQTVRILENPCLYNKIKSHTKCPSCFLPENVMRKIETIWSE